MYVLDQGWTLDPTHGKQILQMRKRLSPYGTVFLRKNVKGGYPRKNAPSRKQEKSRQRARNI